MREPSFCLTVFLPRVAEIYINPVKNLSALKIGKIVRVAGKKLHVFYVLIFDFLCGEKQNVKIFSAARKFMFGLSFAVSVMNGLFRTYFKVHGVVVVKQLFLCFNFLKIVYNKVRARVKAVVAVLFLSHSHKYFFLFACFVKYNTCAEKCQHIDFKAQKDYNYYRTL